MHNKVLSDAFVSLLQAILLLRPLLSLHVLHAVPGCKYLQRLHIDRHIVLISIYWSVVFRGRLAEQDILVDLFFFSFFNQVDLKKKKRTKSGVNDVFYSNHIYHPAVINFTGC